MGPNHSTIPLSEIKSRLLAEYCLKKPTLYRLNSADLCWIFQCDSGLPFSLYFGPKLTFSGDDSDSVDHLLAAIDYPQPLGVLETRPVGSLIPEAGRGFMEHPGIQLSRSGHSLQTQFFNKEVIAESDCLDFIATDDASKSSLRIRIKVDKPSNVFCVTSSVTNFDDEPLNVDWLAACSLNLASHFDEIGLYSGRWRQEFQLQRQRLLGANLVKENRRGRTSAQSFPAVLSGSPGFSWSEGIVYAAHLGWSGNHKILAAKNRDSGHFLQLGELLASGEISLMAGETYQTPPAYVSSSNSGLNPLMANFHHYVRQNILRETTRNTPRPVHYNTWEACYFSQSEEKVLQMIKDAAELGIERFVIDDGWFKNRHDDTSGLGDWEVCEKKYPSGLKAIGQAIKAAGMEFGLWFEPEMVSPDSDLYRANPHWAIASNDLDPVLGRNQLALNLCLPEVFDYLVKTLTTLVSDLEVDYIKWDMNRDLTHVTSQSKASNHELTLAFYRMAELLRLAHPNLIIEVCSAGGARSDFGALSHADRLWPSDNHDILDKQSLAESAGIFFPPEVFGNHIGASPDHQSGRRYSLEQRALVAGMGHMGIEMNVSTLATDDAILLRDSIKDYKTNRDWLQSSTLKVLSNSHTHLRAMLRISRDGSRARLYAMQRGTSFETMNSPLHLSGLKPSSRYKVTQIKFSAAQTTDSAQNPLETTGELLAYAGLPLPEMQPDTWLVFDIRKMSDSNATS